MKRWTCTVFGVVGLGVILGIGGAGRADDAPEDLPELRGVVSSIRTPLPEALRIVEAEVPQAMVARVAIMPGKDGPVYRFVVAHEKGTQLVQVDAARGKLIKGEGAAGEAMSAEQAASLRKAFAGVKSGFVQSIGLAERKAEGGMFFKATAQVRDGKPMYDVLVIRSEYISEVVVDAAEAVAVSMNTVNPAKTWSFDKDRPDALPSGWSVRHTQPGEKPAEWKVKADASAPSRPNVMALTKTENAGSTYNLLMADGTAYLDVDLTVWAKALGGTEDQGGGLVWRAKDENNYYICRYNPLEGNYRVYKVVKGKRIQLESAKVDTEDGKWHEVRARMEGAKITCWLDGRKLLEATDGDIKDAGMIGFWTKADAATAFDDLKARPLGVVADTGGRGR